jgi:DNA polymerase sigma
LQDELNSAGIASRIDVIAKSKVPIIKYVDSITHFSLDVSFNMNNGVEAAKVVKTFVNDPKIGKAIFHLMLLLKQFLAQRHLNEVFTGGLGSYALLCMIASFLKIHPLIVSGEINPMENLGILLIEFFELYGKNFNYQEVGISVTIGNATYYKRDPYEFRPGIVSIRDPQDQCNSFLM